MRGLQNAEEKFQISTLLFSIWRLKWVTIEKRLGIPMLKVYLVSKAHKTEFHLLYLCFQGSPFQWQ